MALLLGNRVELVEMATAAVLAGARFTAVNWHLTAEEVRYVVRDAGARLLVTEPAYVAVAAEAGAGLGVEVVEAGPQLDGLLAGASDEPFPLDGPAGRSMLYTSGTTGRPKGVVRTGPSTVADQLAALAAVGRGVGLDGGGPHLVTGPLYHAAPLGFAVGDLHAGAELVLMPRFDTAATLRLIDERGVRASHFVPTMFVRLLRLDDAARASFDGASLRTVLHGAAPDLAAGQGADDRVVGTGARGVLGNVRGGCVHAGRLAGLARPAGHRRPGGAPLRGVRGRRRREPCCRRARSGRCTAGIGDSEHLFEYHGAPDKTAAVHLEPGVFTMGDIGRVDADGFVHLADRSANVIISGGVNIYPAEIEHVLAEHPAVADVAVFGIPDEEWGEQVKAAVELAPGVAASPSLEAEILAFARARLAGYKVPRSIDVEDELPRHPTGKLYTRLLRDRYWHGRERRV